MNRPHSIWTCAPRRAFASAWVMFFCVALGCSSASPDVPRTLSEPAADVLTQNAERVEPVAGPLLSCRDGECPETIRAVASKLRRFVEEEAEKSASSDGPQPDFIDEDGRRYIWQRKVPVVSGPIVHPVLTPADAERQRNLKPIEEMSLEELASKLRPRLFRNGHEYLLDHDPIDMAIRARENLVPQRTEGYRPPGIPLSVERTAEPGAVEPHFIVGSDNRVSYDHVGISWPAMTFLHAPAANCSATIVGPRTAATAGHCYVPNMPANKAQLAYSSNTSYPRSIPDQSWTYDELVVTSCPVNASSTSVVTANVVHSRPSDLTITLLSPSSTNYVLHNHGSSIAGSWVLNLSSEPANGSWFLVVTDDVAGVTGTLQSWSLNMGTIGCMNAFHLGRFNPIVISAPSGLYNGSTYDWRFDFAYILFPANTFSNWGWVGTTISFSDRNGETCNMWGYPEHRPNFYLPGHPQTNASWVGPRLFFKSGQITDFGYYSSSLNTANIAFRHNLDSYNGDSGAGLLRQWPPDLVAIQSTQYNNGTGGPEPQFVNEARVWNSTVAAFFPSPL